MEQALGSGHRQQSADFSRSAGLPKDGDVIRVAAEIGDVVADPLERGNRVQHPHVRCLGEFRAADIGQVQKTERVQPVVDGYGYYVTLAGEIRTVTGKPRKCVIRALSPTWNTPLERPIVAFPVSSQWPPG